MNVRPLAAAILVATMSSFTAVRAQTIQTFSWAPSQPTTSKQSSEAQRTILFPLRPGDDARKFYRLQGFTVAGNLLVSGWGDRGSLFAELGADTIGPVRLSIGSTISGAEDSEKDESTEGKQKPAVVQNFFAGGGHAVASAAYPLMLWYDEKTPDDPTWHAVLFLNIKGGAILPALGSSVENVIGDVDAGLELHLRLSGAGKFLQPFFQVRGAYVEGTNDFLSVLGARHGFFYTHWTAGLGINDLVQVALNGIWASEATVRDAFGRMTLAVSLTPHSVPLPYPAPKGQHGLDTPPARVSPWP
jgi:hypothetical protein